MSLIIAQSQALGQCQVAIGRVQLSACTRGGTMLSLA